MPHTRVMLPICFAALAMLVTFGCKDPEEYNPEEPLLPPPGPPQILLPYADTTFYTMSNVHHVLFDWTLVPGAEIYEIQTDSTLSWNTATSTLADLPPAYIGLYRYAVTAVYYVRIRAGSAHWTDYTDWSDPRVFYIWLDV